MVFSVQMICCRDILHCFHVLKLLCCTEVESIREVNEELEQAAKAMPFSNFTVRHYSPR